MVLGILLVIATIVLWRHYRRYAYVAASAAILLLFDVIWEPLLWFLVIAAAVIVLLPLSVLLELRVARVVFVIVVVLALLSLGLKAVGANPSDVVRSPVVITDDDGWDADWRNPIVLDDDIDWPGMPGWLEDRIDRAGDPPEVSTPTPEAKPTEAPTATATEQTIEPPNTPTPAPTETPVDLTGDKPVSTITALPGTGTGVAPTAPSSN